MQLQTFDAVKGTVNVNMSDRDGPPDKNGGTSPTQQTDDKLVKFNCNISSENVNITTRDDPTRKHILTGSSLDTDDTSRANVKTSAREDSQVNNDRAKTTHAEDRFVKILFLYQLSQRKL